jgi:arylsulfatase
MTTSSDQRPDILLIMPDQMRGDCLSLENHPVMQTPNIDDIGLRGMPFARGYSTCPSCIPARRAMLTALHPSSPGNGVAGFATDAELNAPIFSQKLLDGGYHTTLVGRHMHQLPLDKAFGFEDRVYATAYHYDDDYGQALEAEFPGQGVMAGHGITRVVIPRDLGNFRMHGTRPRG